MAGGELLRHRDFRLLFAGETVSELGTQVSLLAIPLVAVRTLHVTAFQIGALTAASSAAFLFVGLPAGALVDRLRRRRVMITADLGRLAALGSIPAAYALGHLGLTQLFVVALCAGVLTVFFDVAYQSYLPSLVGRNHLVEANAKLTGSAEVARIAGPSVAGALVQAVGGAYAVAMDAFSFLVSAVAVGKIDTVEATPGGLGEQRRRLRRDIAEGLRFVGGSPLLRAITATTATANLFSGVPAAVEILFLVRLLHVAPGVIGVLFGVASIGGLLGALFAARIARRIGGARATFLGIFATAGGLVVPLASPGIGVIVFAAGLFAGSFGAVVYNINQLSFRQQLCPERLLGRMNATIRFIVSGVLPVGALVGGVIASAIGTRATLWMAMGGQVLAGGWLLASPMRRLRDYPSETV